MSFKCKECDSEFATDHDLHLHMKQAHPLQHWMMHELFSEIAPHPTFY